MQTSAEYESEYVKRNSFKFCLKFSKRMLLPEEIWPQVSDQKLKEGDGKFADDF